MKHLIDKDTLVAEIKKRIHEYAEKADIVSTINTHLSSQYSALIVEYGNMLSFLDTLEVKEVDLEKAIDDYIYTHDGRKRLALELDWKYCNLTLKGGNEIIKFAKYFFELGLKTQKGE